MTLLTPGCLAAALYHAALALDLELPAMAAVADTTTAAAPAAAAAAAAVHKDPCGEFLM